MGEEEATYQDSDGRWCTLPVLCMREPGWAANRIRAERERIAALEAELAEARSECERLKSPAVVMAEAQRLMFECGIVRVLLGMNASHERLVFVDSTSPPDPLGEQLADAYARLVAAKEGG